MSTNNRMRRWPTTPDVVERAERGLVDDRSLAVPLLDLEDAEILGERTPRPAAAKRRARAAKKRTPAA